MAFEQVGKVFFIVVADHLADFVNAVSAARQQGLGVLHPHVGQVLVKIDTHNLLERKGKVGWAEIGQLGHGLEGDWLGVMFFDVALYFTHSLCDGGRGLVDLSLQIASQAGKPLSQACKCALVLELFERIGNLKVLFKPTFVEDTQQKGEQAFP